MVIAIIIACILVLISFIGTWAFLAFSNLECTKNPYIFMLVGIGFITFIGIQIVLWIPILEFLLN